MNPLFTIAIYIGSAVICGMVFEAGLISAPVVWFWGACTTILHNWVIE